MSVNEGVISTFKEIFQTALISLAIFLFVYIFLVQPHRVKGESMAPNFEDGELLLTEKVSYRFGKPIKRIIGTPGDTVAINNGEVLVNDVKLSETYIKIETQGDEIKTLEADEYFVLGDNRGASSDSRVFGPIKKSVIRGRVWFVYWPIIKTTVYRGLRLISGINY